jgi:hypothetical protein
LFRKLFAAVTIVQIDGSISAGFISWQSFTFSANFKRSGADYAGGPLPPSDRAHPGLRRTNRKGIPIDRDLAIADPEESFGQDAIQIAKSEDLIAQSKALLRRISSLTATPGQDSAGPISPRYGLILPRASVTFGIHAQKAAL